MYFLSVLCCFLSSFLAFMLIMLFVAFFILSERKILGYAQLRKGPNKVGVVGLFQSFADLSKLVFKFKSFAFRFRDWLSCVGVFLMIAVVCGYCVLFSLYDFGSGVNNWVLWFLVVSSLVGYGLLMLGWGSYSKFALVSCVRSAFGSLTFEACFMCVVVLLGLVSFDYSSEVLEENWLFCFFLPLVYLFWLLGVLCECNRTPFDYAESESELVSGLSVEYSGVPFTCLFASEYAIMFMFAFLTSLIFWGSGFLLGGVMFHIMLFIWFRASLPRSRYDVFIRFMWCSLVPVLLLAFFLAVYRY
uniref:NADH-ubiquinone oxidoreductase chain 1 n=1 Tax=Lyperosomum longicauda TaxID=2714089 RepID=A0A6H0YBB5_9TREM|nr:NADH dehydrogenase subunit 1 [Lyperosomum longicauda]QIX04655.1 NADH dehydrogenase subunit 1 [Lyperosomum longicauda]